MSQLSSLPAAPVAAMILAAGRGERMRPLSNATPKPLLKVGGKPLLQWPLEALARGGFDRVVVNTAWLGEQISANFGSVFVPQPTSNKHSALLNEGCSTNSVQLAYSREGRDFGGALETAGGIVRALPLLCPLETAGTTSGVFWVLAGDVFAPDFVFSQAAVERFAASGRLAHLWLVPNPAHNLRGDFGLSREGLALDLPSGNPRQRYTYSTIGLYRKALFAPPWCDIPAGNPGGLKAPLAPLLRAAIDDQRVSAELYEGTWTDVGTPERLVELNQAAKR